MDKLKKYRLVHTTPAHFILHDGKAHFHIAKKGLDSAMIDKIQSLYKGGEPVENPVEKEKEKAFQEKKETSRSPASIATPEQEAFTKSFNNPSPGAQNIMKKAAEYLGFNEGGEAEGAFSSEDKFLTHNGDHGPIHKETSSDPYLPNVQHFAGETGNPQDQVVQPNLLPADFKQQVEQEKANLYSTSTAMPPMQIDNSNIVPKTAQPQNLNEFQTQAETNVAARFQEQQAEQLRQAENARIATEQSIKEANNKILGDNKIRAQSGLPLIPLKPGAEEPAKQPAEKTVSPDQQVSFAQPQKSSISELPKIDLVSDFQKNLDLVKSGIIGNAKLQSELLNQNAALLDAQVKEQQQRKENFETEQAKLMAENNNLMQAVKDNTIDPSRIWHNASTGAKISAGLGLIFGSIGSAMTGQANTAASFIEKAIAEDVEAQKTDQSNRMNLYKLGLEKYNDKRAAEQFALLQSQAILSGQLQKVAAKIGSAQALQIAKQAIGELGIKYQPMMQELTLKQMALNYSQPTQQSGINRGKMTAFMNAGMYDDATKKELVKEDAEYTKMTNLLNETDRVMKDAAAFATWTSRIPGASHLPTFREKSKQYNSVVNSYLDKMTKDLTGRVTPQSMENLHSSMPLVDDSPETVARKMNDLKDIIKGGYAFPTLINKGLLNPNDPQVQSTGNVRSKFTPGKPIIK